MNELVQHGFDFKRHLRCGALIGREDLASESSAAAICSPSELFLHVRMEETELARFESPLVPISTRLTVFPSPAGVMYAVLSIQSGAQQWRHVLPLWNERARQWLEDVIAQQRVSLALHVSERDQVAVMQVGTAIPQSEALLRLAEDWPELADQDKAVDLAFMLKALAQLDAIASAHNAFMVEEIRVITHCAWLNEYLTRTGFEQLCSPADIEAYSRNLH